jgi:prepilin-type N-terminal cleavage/methylation domain-containing protein
MPSNPRCRSLDRSDGGFSLLEMVIAITLLTIGLLGVASAIGYAMVASNRGRSITNTKLLAVTILEQMETLRNTGQLTFGQIANVNQVSNTGAVRKFAGFPVGPQQVSTNPGPDGIFGTADDLVDSNNLVNPNFAVVGITRQIQITSLGTSLKRVEVTVNYSVNGSMKQLTAISYLNDNSQSSFIP